MLAVSTSSGGSAEELAAITTRIATIFSSPSAASGLLGVERIDPVTTVEVSVEGPLAPPLPPLPAAPPPPEKKVWITVSGIVGAVVLGVFVAVQSKSDPPKAVVGTTAPLLGEFKFHGTVSKTD